MKISRYLYRSKEMSMTNETVKPTKRLLWIDYARFMSLFLVTAYHVPVTLPVYPRWTFFFLQLPGFIFISGLLFRFEKYPSFVDYFKHRSKQLLIPYAFFILLFYALWIAKTILKGGAEVPLWQPLSEALAGRPSTVCGPLWFVACLFSLQCIFYILFKRVNNRWTALIIITLVSLSFAFLYDTLKGVPWVLDSALAYLPFYGIAVFFRKEILELMNKPVRFPVAIICLIIHAVILYLTVNTSFSDLTGNILRILASFSVIFPYCVLLKALTLIVKERKIISLISSNGVVVLACHIYAISIVLHLFGLTPENMEGNYFLKYGIATIVMLSMSIPIFLINRYFPFMLGKGKLLERM